MKNRLPLPPRRPTNAAIRQTAPAHAPRAPRPLIEGRAPLPTVVRGDRSPSFTVLAVVGALILLAVLLKNASLPEMDFGTFSSTSGSGTALANNYEIRKVTLQNVESMPGRTSWRVTAHVSNATSRQINGPRLRIRLLRQDETVAAEQVVDYTNRPLSERSSFLMTQKLDVDSNEALKAEVVVVPPREGALGRGE